MPRYKILIVLAAFLLPLAPSPGGAATETRETVRFGLCPKYNPRLMYLYFQPIMDYLSEDSPYLFEIKLSKVYGGTVKNLGRRLVHLGSCGPVPYIQAHEEFGIVPILRGLTNEGKGFYRSVIVTKKGSGIEKLSDLKGRSVAFGQRLSTAGFIIPQHYLAKEGICLEDLGRYKNLRHHDLVVKAVLRGEYDAGAVKEIVARKYENLLTFLHISDPIPTVPFVALPDTPAALIDHIRDRLLALDPGEPSDRELMKTWDEEFRYGFITADDGDYDSVRRILDAPKNRCQSLP